MHGILRAKAVEKFRKSATLYESKLGPYFLLCNVFMSTLAVTFALFCSLIVNYLRPKCRQKAQRKFSADFLFFKINDSNAQ